MELVQRVTWGEAEGLSLADPGQYHGVVFNFFN